MDIIGGVVPAVQFTEVTAAYSQRVAVRDLTFAVYQDEFASIVGPSGCGKTTILKLAAGLLRVRSGRVSVNGAEVNSVNTRCGYVPQAYPLFPWLTVRENIGAGLRFRNEDPTKICDRVNMLLRDIGLTEYGDVLPRALSGGMQQRVAIARALATDPNLLLMDEPFGSLDSKTRSQMQDNLLNTWAKAQRSVLFVTHDIDEAVYLSDRVIVVGHLPGTVRARVSIPLPRPRVQAMKYTQDFLSLVATIDQNL